MSLPRLLGIKQGVNFTVQLDYSFNAIPEVVDPATLSAQVRTINGTLLSQLAITADPLAVVGRFFAKATPAQTAVWPVGDVYFDIKRTTGGIVSATETCVLAVTKKVTA